MRSGDVVQVSFGIPTGAEPGFVRPAIVVTADAVLSRRPRTLHVVPLTSNVRRALPTEVAIDDAGLATPSAAQCHLCTVISLVKLRDPDGDHSNIGAVALAQIRAVLADLLDIA